MKKLVLDTQALKQNILAIKEQAGGIALYGVLIGDAYGAGLAEIAKLLRDAGIGRFAISEPAEAAALRKEGFVDEEILMLRSTANREELEQLMDLNVVCTIGSTDAGMALNALAESRSTVAEAQVLIDTGLGFGGFFAEDPEKIFSIYQNLPNVAVSGLYTEIHSASEKTARNQLDIFGKVLEAVRQAGFETGTVHAAGSYALLHYDISGLNAARVGSALLGRCRRTHDDGLKKIGYGEVALEDIRWLPKGHTVGKEASVTLRKPTRVAVVPVGYQNGFSVARTKDGGLITTLRDFWSRRNLTVTVAGKKARVIGRVGAIETVIDVTNLKCTTGELATFEVDPLFTHGFQREYR